jgi:hypothetical protein
VHGVYVCMAVCAYVHWNVVCVAWVYMCVWQCCGCICVCMYVCVHAYVRVYMNTWLCDV